MTVSLIPEILLEKDVKKILFVKIVFMIKSEKFQF